MDIRLENKADYYEVENLTREAFWDVYRPGCSEHLVLNHLRQAESFIKDLDYVMVENNQIIGNIVYSKMFRGQERQMSSEVIAFGPISVHPDYQKQGIGKKMIHYSMQKAKELGYKAVMITGNNNYYNRLGFASASKYHIFLPGMSEKEEAVFFMVKELEEGYLVKNQGIYDFDRCFEVDNRELEVFDKKFSPKTKREPRSTDLM
jgi:predicted N-acetyltransferase YhbS